MSVHVSGPPAPLFVRARHEFTEFKWRRNIVVKEIPSPQRIAPHALAMAATIESKETELGNGRLILLHDPSGSEVWDGQFRAVSYARADVDRDLVSNPLLGEIGWSWLTDSLRNSGALFRAESGTVTTVASRSFGEISADPDHAEIEIRASWTPHFDAKHGFITHLSAWQELLYIISGLPSASSVIVPIETAKRPKSS